MALMESPHQIDVVNRCDHGRLMSGNSQPRYLENRMPKMIGAQEFYSTQEVAIAAGISKATLLRWLKNGDVPEPMRDRRGWRIFSEDHVGEIRAWAHKTI